MSYLPVVFYISYLTHLVLVIATHLPMPTYVVCGFGSPCRTCLTSKSHRRGSQMERFETPCSTCQTCTSRDRDSQIQRSRSPCRICKACKLRERGSQVQRFATPCGTCKPQFYQRPLIPQTPNAATWSLRAGKRNLNETPF